MNDQETWKPIPSFPRYEASSQGRIRSVDRTIETETRGTRHTKGRVLKQMYYGRYMVVNVYRDKKMYNKPVHRLVAEAFLGPCPTGMIVLHGPSGRLDNTVLNLSYGTPAQNSGPDRVRDGTAPIGSRNPKSKLTETDILVIRQRLQVESLSSIARDYGCTKTLISQIKLNKIWTHV